MKKLLLISNYFPYGNDTGEIYLRSEIEYLSKVYDKVVIISCDAHKKDKLSIELPNNVETIKLQNKSKFLIKIGYFFKTFKLFFSKKKADYCEEYKEQKSFLNKIFLLYFIAKSEDRLKKINSELNIDLKNDDDWIIYSYRLFDLAYIAIKIKNLIKNNVSTVKTISRAHGYDLYEEINKLGYLPMRTYLLQNLDRVYPCSKYGQVYLKSKYKINTDNIICMYLGSNDYGICTTKKIQNCIEIVSCSNVVPVKQVDKIANIVREISKCERVHWTHIGSGKLLDSIKIANRDLVDNKTISFIGALNHDLVIEFYKNHYFDLFINMSKSEGLPQAIMEAMSFGMPVAATNVGGNSEIVNCENGILVEPEETSEKIAADIIRFYKNISLNSDKKRKEVRKEWEKTFYSTNNIKLFIKELERD